MKLLPVEPNELRTKLGNYLANNERYHAIFAHTRRRLDDAPALTAHNWEHAYRDTLNAIYIGEAEHADMHIVLPAITMHDIGFLYGATGKTHGAVGAEHVAAFAHEAGANYSDEELAHIAACIRTHKGSMHNEKPETLEAKVVADADLMEKFGPFGVYSGLQTFAEFRLTLEEAIARESQMSMLTLETPTGQKLAEPGRRFVIDFYRQLAEAASAYLPIGN